jgi:hypothetical protein
MRKGEIIEVGYLRKLLVVGACATLRWRKGHNDALRLWPSAMLERNGAVMSTACSRGRDGSAGSDDWSAWLFAPITVARSAWRGQFWLPSHCQLVHITSSAPSI